MGREKLKDRGNEERERREEGEGREKEVKGGRSLPHQ